MSMNTKAEIADRAAVNEFLRKHGFKGRNSNVLVDLDEINGKPLLMIQFGYAEGWRIEVEDFEEGALDKLRKGILRDWKYDGAGSGGGSVEFYFIKKPSKVGVFR